MFRKSYTRWQKKTKKADGGFVAKGCGAIMSDRRKNKDGLMAEKGLRAWVKENWVDIANKRKDGSYPKCGRSGGEKEKLSKMRAYCKSKSDEQRAACGCRKEKTSESKYWPDTE